MKKPALSFARGKTVSPINYLMYRGTRPLICNPLSICRTVPLRTETVVCSPSGILSIFLFLPLICIPSLARRIDLSRIFLVFAIFFLNTNTHCPGLKNTSDRPPHFYSLPIRDILKVELLSPPLTYDHSPS